MKICSLFAGIGGFDLALTRLGHEIVYVNEWDKYASQTYEKNFKQIPDTRDIRTVRAGEIPDHDLLVGGFPCQAFSIAGKRGGFKDIRGTLFFEIARILAEKKPRLFLLENVKGLLNHAGGETFQTILNTLDELGYDLQWQVCNSKYFGVPQNRERVFIVGHLRGTSRPEIFPITATNEENGKVEIRPEARQQVSPTLSTPSGGHHTPTIRYPLKFLQRNQKNITGDYSYTVDGANTGGVMIANTIDANYYKGVNGNPGHASSNRGYEIGGQIRRLTPIECERLQGFPDGWTEGVSDTQRYKQLGNAVTVNVVYEIAKRMLG